MLTSVLTVVTVLVTFTILVLPTEFGLMMVCVPFKVLPTGGTTGNVALIGLKLV